MKVNVIVIAVESSPETFSFLLVYCLMLGVWINHVSWYAVNIEPYSLIILWS